MSPVLIGALTSKTIWLNVGMVAVQALLEGLGNIGLDAQTYALIQIAANVAVRSITGSSLKDKGKARQEKRSK